MDLFELEEPIVLPVPSESTLLSEVSESTYDEEFSKLLEILADEKHEEPEDEFAKQIEAALSPQKQSEPEQEDEFAKQIEAALSQESFSTSSDYAWNFAQMRSVINQTLKKTLKNIEVPALNSQRWIEILTPEIINTILPKIKANEVKFLLLWMYFNSRKPAKKDKEFIQQMFSKTDPTKALTFNDYQTLFKAKKAERIIAGRLAKPVKDNPLEYRAILADEIERYRQTEINNRLKVTETLIGKPLSFSGIYQQHLSTFPEQVKPMPVKRELPLGTKFPSLPKDKLITSFPSFVTNTEITVLFPKLKVALDFALSGLVPHPNTIGFSPMEQKRMREIFTFYSKQHISQLFMEAYVSLQYETDPNLNEFRDVLLRLSQQAILSNNSNVIIAIDSHSIKAIAFTLSNSSFKAILVFCIPAYTLLLLDWITISNVLPTPDQTEALTEDLFATASGISSSARSKSRIIGVTFFPLAKLVYTDVFRARLLSQSSVGSLLVYDKNNGSMIDLSVKKKTTKAYLEPIQLNNLLESKTIESTYLSASKVNQTITDRLLGNTILISSPKIVVENHMQMLRSPSIHYLFIAHLSKWDYNSEAFTTLSFILFIEMNQYLRKKRDIVLNPRNYPLAMLCILFAFYRPGNVVSTATIFNNKSLFPQDNDKLITQWTSKLPGERKTKAEKLLKWLMLSHTLRHDLVNEDEDIALTSEKAKNWVETIQNINSNAIIEVSPDMKYIQRHSNEKLAIISSMDLNEKPNEEETQINMKVPFEILWKLDKQQNSRIVSHF